jgi:DNA-binding NarL/FixJ family response regulator
VRLVRAGAHGYLTDDMNGEHLVRAVEVVDRGGLWIERHILDRLFLEQRDTARFVGEAVSEKACKLRESLTRREAQILVLVMHGLSVKELAREVCLSEQGVKVHLSRLFARFDVHNRSQLILAVMRQLAPCGGMFDNIMQALAPQTL